MVYDLIVSQLSKNDKVEDIVRKFGTHVVTSSNLGGKLDYYFTLSQDIKTEIEKVVTSINVKILFFKSSSTTVDEKTWTEIKKDFQGNFVVTGGGDSGTILNRQMKSMLPKENLLLTQHYLKMVFVF